MDFVHDQLLAGRPCRGLTLIDHWSREGVLLEPAFRFRAMRVAALLDAAIARAGRPVSIKCDHGTEFTSRALES